VLTKRFNTYILLLKYILAVYTAGILFLGCDENNVEKVETLNVKNLTPIQITFNTKLTFNSNGKVNFILKADRMERFVTADSSFVEFFGNVFLEGFNKEGIKESEMSSEYAIYLQDSYKMIARKNVVLVNLNKDKLQTEELTWNQKTKKIFTNKAVTITQSDGIINGIGLDADESFENYNITQITGTFDVEDLNEK